MKIKQWPIEAAHDSFKAVKMSGKIKGTDRERHTDTETLRKGMEKRQCPTKVPTLEKLCLIDNLITLKYIDYMTNKTRYLANNLKARPYPNRKM